MKEYPFNNTQGLREHNGRFFVIEEKSIANQVFGWIPVTKPCFSKLDASGEQEKIRRKGFVYRMIPYHREKGVYLNE